MSLAAIKKNRAQAEKTLQEVCLSLDGKKIVFVFENGEGCSIPRHQIPDDDGSTITHLEIFDHGCATLIYQASGNSYDLPWDSIRHYAKGGKRKPLLLGLRIRTLRKKQSLSQAQLAWRSGLSRVHLSRVEQNKSKPTLETLEKIAKSFHLSLAELVS